MRIRRIELTGFKSFVDRTTFQFGPGICGIVGPNGCGKSNVIDAIKWTLGEQSASTLRGKAMEDVIFAGSDSRAPSGRAEVVIAFDNTDGVFGGRYRRFSEIQIGRRLHRGGRSDYLLNQTPARLKDIVELFMDSGVGARAYSIIEQGRVDTIVNASPAQMRVFIEEVAGINRFKQQRVEAERRMHRTRDNLLRVADRAAELGKQRTQLERQAEKASSFRRLRAEYKAASLKALVAEGLALRADHEAKMAAVAELVSALRNADADELTAQEAAAAAESAAGDARQAHEQLREERQRAESDAELKAREQQFRSEERKGLLGRLETLGAELTELDERIGELRRDDEGAAGELADGMKQLSTAESGLRDAVRAESTARELAEKSRHAVEDAKSKALHELTEAGRCRNLAQLLDARVTAAQASLVAAGEEQATGARDIEAAEVAAASARETLSGAAAERAALRERREQAGWAVQHAKTHAREVDAARDAARRDIDRVKARRDSLTELLERFEGFSDGVRMLMARYAPTDDSGVLGVVADLLVVPEESEVAVAAALGDLAQGVVFRDAKAARRAADWVLAEDLPRVRLIALGGKRANSGLAAVVTDESAPGLAAQLLGEAELVEDLPSRSSAPKITADGARLDRHGWLVGRAADAAAGHRARQRDAEALQIEVDEQTARLAVAEAAAEQAAEALTARKSERDELAAEAHQAELRELACKRDASEAAAALDRARGAADRIARARERAQSELANLTTQRGTARTQADEAEARGAAIDEQIAQLRATSEAASADAARAAEAATTVRVSVAELRQRVAGRQREHRRLQSQLDDLLRRRDRLDRERTASTARRDQLARDIARLAAESTERTDAAGVLQTRVTEAEAARQAADAGLAAARAAVTEVGSGLATLRSRRGAADVALAEVRSALKAVGDRAAEFDLLLRPLLEQLENGDSPTVEFKGEGSVELLADELPPESVAAFAEQATRLDAKIEGLGPVNLGAGDEFAEVDARWSELVGQKEDLESALKDLVKAIAKIEKETRERFRTAFDGVAGHFGRLYPRLVGGGRAELTLTTPDDLLETGVDMIVEPPGKRPQNLNLLSGGEKAMAAIALVFAIFQVKPSPFCLLDEVDAPLDEANSRRFNSMLRELATDTQFVVITHNRTTMEVADFLYGVTMQKAGVSSVVSVRLDEVPEDQDEASA